MYAELLVSPVVLYVRVSSDKQAERHTIESQVYELRRYCERCNITVSAVYRDDGVNGDLGWQDRPGARQMIADARAGKVRTVLVYMYDRYSRDVLEGLLAARMLKEAGATSVSLNEAFDITTPHGYYMFVNSLNNAQWMKAQTLLRMRDGRARRLEDGGWVGGSPPIGYRIERRGGIGHLAIDEESTVPNWDGPPASVVRWIFEQVASGRILSDVSEELNERGVPTPSRFVSRKFHRKAGMREQWRPYNIWHIVNSPTYKGFFQWGRRVPERRAIGAAEDRSGIIEVPCPAVVSVDLWERCRKSLTANALMSARNTQSFYLLRGLIRCGVCGSIYCGRTDDAALFEESGGVRGRSYVCSRRYVKKGYGNEPCGSPSVPGSIERDIWDSVVAFLTDPKRVAWFVSRHIEAIASASEKAASDPGNESRLQSLRASIEAKTQERQAVLNVFRSGWIDADALKSQLETIDAEEREVRTRISEIEEASEKAEIELKRIGNAASSVLQTSAAMLAKADADTVSEEGVRPHLETLPDSSKRALVTAWVSQIVVSPNILEGRTIPSVSVTYEFGPRNTDEGKPSFALQSIRQRQNNRRFSFRPPWEHDG